MKTNFLIISLIAFSVFSCKKEKKDLHEIISESFKNAVVQYKAMEINVPDDMLPRSTRPDSSLWLSKPDWWTSGFYPGSLWYLYEYSKDPDILTIALKRLKTIENQQFFTRDHDIGFQMNCSYGNAFRITGDSIYIPFLINSANSLITRFNQTVGCIRSWGNVNDMDEYKVIVDNMMNLELLFKATELTGDSNYFNIAVSHADKTLQNHFRPDGSSYHLVSYNPKTGMVQYKKTVQGYADESAWSRGQSWGLYGYTMCYRTTGYQRYLEQAIRIADFIVNHPNLPEDKIPYWDLNAPDIPVAKRDASAAAIIASALIELSDYMATPLKEKYMKTAEIIISTLSSGTYRSEPGENNNFILMHGVGNIPENSEVDVPLSYADYYYLEAMLRLNQIVKN